MFDVDFCRRQFPALRREHRGQPVVYLDGPAGSQTPQWLSTHPSHETRIRDLQDYSQRVMPLYEKAKR